MPPEVETSEEVQDTSANDAASAALDEIVGAGTRMTSGADVSEPDSSSAPDEGNSRPSPFDYDTGSEATPEAGQPDEDKGSEGDATGDADATSKPDESGGESTGTESEEGDETGGKPAEGDEGDEGEDAELLDMLGLTPEEPDTIESLKEKYAASSGEGRRLKDRLSEIEQMLLNSKGVRLVETKDGLDLVPSDDYVKEISDDDVPDVGDISQELPQSVRDTLDELDDKAKDVVSAIAKAASKRAMTKLLADRPSVLSEKPRTFISQDESDQCVEDLKNAKLRDGVTPRFPDADKADVQDLMHKMYSADANQSLRDWMSESKDNFFQGLEHLYTKVALGRVRRAIQAQDAKRQQKETESKNKQDASVTAGVDNVERKDAKDGAPKGEADRALDDLVGAKPQ